MYHIKFHVVVVLQFQETALIRWLFFNNQLVRNVTSGFSCLGKQRGIQKNETHQGDAQLVGIQLKEFSIYLFISFGTSSHAHPADFVLIFTKMRLILIDLQ